jgi:hypothetical protein
MDFSFLGLLLSSVKRRRLKGGSDQDDIRLFISLYIASSLTVAPDYRPIGLSTKAIRGIENGKVLLDSLRRGHQRPHVSIEGS